MKSKIEWTDKTWNPITGCTKYSSGCVNCYAEMMSRRLKTMGIKKYENERASSFWYYAHGYCPSAGEVPYPVIGLRHRQ